MWGSVPLLRWHAHDVHSEGRRWVERSEGDRRGGPGCGRREGHLLGTAWCFTDAVALNSQTTLRLIVHFMEEETEAKKGASFIPSHD